MTLASPLALLLLACAPIAAATEQAPPPDPAHRVAVFAGGCFWCMEKPFDQVPGVLSTTSGYIGGPEVAPTYKQVASHQTGHYEALRVVYDPDKVGYERLVEVFWHNIDPTQADGQFCDRGSPYRSAIFTSDPEELAIAERTKQQVGKDLGKPVATVILPAGPFWVAEDYHQDFYVKNPEHYQRYRKGCGRDARLKALWGDKAGR